MGDRKGDNFDRLRQFEMAERSQVSNKLATDRGERQQAKMDFDQQYKLGEAERRAQESAMRATAATERSALMEKQLALQDSAAALKALKEETNAADSLRATEHKIGFLKATRDLKESDDEFEQKLSDAMAEFPHASKDEFVQKRLGWLTGSRDEYRKMKTMKDKEAADRAEAERLKLPVSEIKVGATTYKSPPAENFGTQTIKEGETTTTRPLPAPDSPQAQAQLLSRHDQLLSGLKAKEGKSNPTSEEIGAINNVRKQLGFELLDNKGAAIPGTDRSVRESATITTPAGTETVTVKDTDVPTLTGKDQFDALPSGAYYIRDGKRYQKP